MEVAVRLKIRCLGFPLTAGLEGRVARSFKWAMERFAGAVRALRVSLSDVNGPHGGCDKKCLVEMALTRRRKVVITEVQPDMYAAIDCAAGRAHRILARALSAGRSNVTGTGDSI